MSRYWMLAGCMVCENALVNTGGLSSIEAILKVRRFKMAETHEACKKKTLQSRSLIHNTNMTSNNVGSTSMRRYDVAATLLWRCFKAVCLLG